MTEKSQFGSGSAAVVTNVTDSEISESEDAVTVISVRDSSPSDAVFGGVTLTLIF